MVHDLAAEIASDARKPLARAEVLEIAQAQIEIQRARHARGLLIEQTLGEPPAALGKVTEQSAKIERYERRAISRRNSLIRQIDRR